MPPEWEDDYWHENNPPNSSPFEVSLVIIIFFLVVEPYIFSIWRNIWASRENDISKFASGGTCIAQCKKIHLLWFPSCPHVHALTDRDVSASSEPWELWPILENCNQPWCSVAVSDDKKDYYSHFQLGKPPDDHDDDDDDGGDVLCGKFIFSPWSLLLHHH